MSKEQQLLVASKIDTYTSNRCRIIRNENEPYTLFNFTDIGKIIGIKNVRENNVLSTDKQIMLTNTAGGGKQKMMYISYVGLLKTLTKSRKRLASELAIAIGIDVQQIKFMCLEASTIDCICKTFKGEETIEQFRVSNYNVDLYFPSYKLAVECDEKLHDLMSHTLNDIVRSRHIEEELGCTFIRYSPQSLDFNIFEVLNKIFNHIKTYKL